MQFYSLRDLFPNELIVFSCYAIQVSRNMETSGPSASHDTTKEESIHVNAEIFICICICV
jgi:hypothetical protein